MSPGLPRNLCASLIGCALFAATGSAQRLVDHPTIPNQQLPEGYRLRVVVQGLNFPSNIAIGPGGRAWVTEAGFPGVPPMVKAVTLPQNGDGSATPLLSPSMLPEGTLIPPFTDITYHAGMLWLAHRQTGANGWNVGAYSRFDPNNPAGTFVTVITNLPSVGDHSNNTLVFGADGRAYFGQGSATNSAVVGPDNNWVEDAPGFHEMAAVPLVLNGDSFTSRVPSPLDPDSNAVTAPYRPFDSGDIEPGYMVPAASFASPVNGIIAGSGTVYSFDPLADNPASTLRLEAWGLRNPFGLTFDAEDSSRLFISNNGSDIRGRAGDPSDPFNTAKFVKTGNHPIAEDWDDIFEIRTGGEVEFFGWPDYLHNPTNKAVLRVDDPLFCSSPVLSPADCPQPLFDSTFGASLTVKTAFTELGRYVSTTGLEASASEAFGYSGDVFVTESGSFPPQTGTFSFTGYKVRRVDRVTGEVSDFVVNNGNAPEEIFAPGKLHKPVSVAFMGDRLAIVDLGILEPGINIFQPNTGAVWILERAPLDSVSVATGSLATSAGEQTVYICPGPGNSDPIAVQLGYSVTNGQVGYVVTDPSFNIIGLPPSMPVDLSGAGTGTCYIFAFNYTGNRTVALGDNVYSTRFSDGEYLISNNAIRVVRELPVAGAITSQSGNTVEYACIGDGQPDFIGFRTSGESDAEHVYIVTDAQDNILGINRTGFQDFEPAGEGNCRVYSLSYTGELLARTGDNLDSAELSTTCSDLSDDFLTIVRLRPDGGRVTVNGSERVRVNSGQSITAATTSAATGTYTYFLLGSDFVVDATSTTGQFDLTGAAPGRYFIYGVSHSGDNMITAGMPYFGTRLSRGCYAQSSNAVVVDVTGPGFAGVQPVPLTLGQVRLDVADESIESAPAIGGSDPASETTVTVSDALGRVLVMRRFAPLVPLDGTIIEVPEARTGVHVVSVQRGAAVQSEKFVF